MRPEDGIQGGEIFYTWAWNDVYRVVLTLRFNGGFPWCDDLLHRWVERA